VHARALECFQTIDGEPPVARASGDHDRACHRPLAIRKPEHKGPVLGTARWIEPHDLLGYRHLDPEFLRLIVCTCHQRNAADSRRKAQIVLDARGSPSLPTECTAVENENRQSFRARVDGTGEARGARTDDDDVIEAVRIDRPQQADAAGELGFGRIAQQLPAGTKHDRQLTGIDMKTLDQCLGLGIGLGIQPLVGMAIAAEKSFEPKHIGVLRTAHDHRAAGAGLEQPDPAQNQRTHDVLAELRFGDEQCAQLSGRDDERFDLLLRMGVDERRSACELRQLAHEGSRPMGHDVAAATRFIVLSDIHPSGQDDRETWTDMADLHERLAGTISADLAETAHALDIRRLQNRKHLVAARVDDRLRGSRHDKRTLSTNVPRQTAGRTDRQAQISADAAVTSGYGPRPRWLNVRACAAVGNKRTSKAPHPHVPDL